MLGASAPLARHLALEVGIEEPLYMEMAPGWLGLGVWIDFARPWNIRLQGYQAQGLGQTRGEPRSPASSGAGHSHPSRLCPFRRMNDTALTRVSG